MSSFGDERKSERSIGDSGEPLSEREKQQILRLFSEPMELPLVFRSWVKNYVETVGISLPKSAIIGLMGSTTTTLDLQPGLILLVPEGREPPGTLPLTGGSVERSAQPRLAEVLGNGEDSFPIPALEAPAGTTYVITTGRQPSPVRESEET